MEDQSDVATSIAVDNDENVYVTGNSDYDYFTVAYNSIGVEQWTARFNGPASVYPLDSPNMLALDSWGNIYVTGYSKGANGNDDYATIKYDAASGNELWVARYNGPGNYDDRAIVLKVDNTGSIYVTGWSWGTPQEGANFTTIKYDSNGVEQWIAQFDRDIDRPTSLVVDEAKNVYVTGSSDHGTNTKGEFSTVKYTPEGILVWATHYLYNEDSDDRAMAIAVDNLGNVYASGTSYESYGSIFTTIKYIQMSTSIDEGVKHIPKRNWLAQNYPNPFNPNTKIEYHLSETSRVILEIFNILGERVHTLVNAQQIPGFYQVEWDGNNEHHQQVASGIYVYRLRTEKFSHSGSANTTQTFVQSKKMILLR